jgi:hypothetical protein
MSPGLTQRALPARTEHSSLAKADNALTAEPRDRFTALDEPEWRDRMCFEAASLLARSIA